MCPCAPSYYDNGVQLCIACHYSCKNCYGIANNNCIQCTISNNRIDLSMTNNTCPCKVGFYQPNLPVP